MKKSGILLAIGLWLGVGAAAQDKKQDNKKKPPASVKEIMKRTHEGKDNLASEVRNGFGTKEMQKKLLAEYQTLATLKPPRGEEKSWKDRTGAVISALTDLVDGKDTLGRVHATTDCRACHDAHRVGGNK